MQINFTASNAARAGLRLCIIQVALDRVEKERIKDSLLKLQSVANSLDQVDSKEIPRLEDVQECLEDADEILGGALRSPGSGETKK